MTTFVDTPAARQVTRKALEDHVRELERRALAGDTFAIRSLAALALVKEQQ